MIRPHGISLASEKNRGQRARHDGPAHLGTSDQRPSAWPHPWFENKEPNTRGPDALVHAAVHHRCLPRNFCSDGDADYEPTPTTPRCTARCGSQWRTRRASALLPSSSSRPRAWSLVRRPKACSQPRPTNSSSILFSVAYYCYIRLGDAKVKENRTVVTRGRLLRREPPIGEPCRSLSVVDLLLSRSCPRCPLVCVLYLLHYPVSLGFHLRL